MQQASDKYIESMKLPFRNRAYIRGSIGIINSEATKDSVSLVTIQSSLSFSDRK